MIPLLITLDAAAHAAAAAPVATPRALALLGWERVTAQVARYCVNPRAAAAVRGTLPFADAHAIELLRTLADELRPAGEANHWPPVSEVDAALAQLARPSPRRLEGSDLVQVAALAADLDALRVHLARAIAAMPQWAAAAQAMAPFDALVAEIRRCLDRDGRLADRASPVLARLRRAAASQERHVRQAVGDAMDGARSRGLLTGDEVTLRGDRFCLPVRSGERRKINGIVHDRSSTGATIFVEPAGVVHLANELAELRLEIGAEETRILLALNRLVDAAADDLGAAAGVLLLVDRVRAGMLWSRQRRGVRCRLERGATLRVCQGRHPLLAAALDDARQRGEDHGDVVPLDLELPAAVRAVVISGANAGGKSVAMKTVGVFVLLAQAGWDVPAREDTRLPLVRQLHVDLGDEQSIEESLSSFSAHLTHLRRFLADADENSLVLCDEIGTGTDPQEGTALAFAVLERLTARGALVIASTHYGLLKAAVNDHPAMINAAMDYDEASLQPLFAVRLGDPGASHAFDIARRVGLDADLLTAARARVGEDRVQIEALLADLGRRARRFVSDQADLDVRRQQLAARERELDTRLGDLDRDHKRELARVRRAGDDLLAEARREIERAVREVRDTLGEKVVVKRARDVADDLARRLPDVPASEPTRGGAPEVGDRVRVPHLGLKGRVTEVRGNQITVVAEGMRLTVAPDGVERIAESGEPATGPAAVVDTAGPRDRGGWSWQGDASELTPELDLRGQRVEEAWERVDRLLDRALPVGLTSITLIHGIGTGRLRDTLLERLARDSRVASCRPAGEQESNPGATIVTLRE